MPFRTFERTIYFVLCETKINPEAASPDKLFNCDGSDEFDTQYDAKRAGWKIDGEQAYCPYCSKSIVK